MISWSLYSNDDELSRIASYGQLVTDEAQVKSFLTSPYQVLNFQAVQIHRNIDDTTYQVFVWNFHQQIIVNRQLSIQTATEYTEYDLDQFWNTLLEVMQATLKKVSLPNFEIDFPIASFLGYYGYLGYELSRHLEQYTHRHDSPSYPSLLLGFPTRLLITSPSQFLFIELDLDSIPSYLLECNPDTTGLQSGGITHGTDYPTYLSDLERVIDHIKKGDIYQANYTQQFRLEIPPDFDPIATYQEILRQNHLPHAAYLNYDSFQILSISPELFLQISNGRVLTKPIKGTRPRGSTAAEDQDFINELVASTKDQAELAMIVDLLRNDLGKSCLPGTVEVEKHAVVETYENVHHLVSSVTAAINPDFEDSWKLLLRALPGGSISGVPKLRSLEIIEANENVTRDIYTGNIGYIGLKGDMEFNIAIRTAILTHAPNQSIATFNAGGGIVFDSDPFEEYIESLHKAKHLANYLGHSFIGHLCYVDGQYNVADQLNFSPTTTGVFDTILVEDGVINHWDLHYQRMKRGITYYNLELTPPDKKAIHKLLRLNVAENGTNRLNIYLWRDETGNDHIAMKIQPYLKSSDPVKLLLDSTITFSPPSAVLKGLKSLDYSPYRKAMQTAWDHDCWDMILIGDNNTILEGGRSNLYFLVDGTWYTPDHSVVNGVIRQYLLNQDAVEVKELDLDIIPRVSAIAVSNALNLVREVKQIQSPAGEVIWQFEENKKFDELLKYF